MVVLPVAALWPVMNVWSSRSFPLELLEVEAILEGDEIRSVYFNRRMVILWRSTLIKYGVYGVGPTLVCGVGRTYAEKPQVVSALISNGDKSNSSSDQTNRRSSGKFQGMRCSSTTERVCLHRHCRHAASAVVKPTPLVFNLTLSRLIIRWCPELWPEAERHALCATTIVVRLSRSVP